MLLFRNNAHSSLAAALSDVATTLTVATGHGDRFPAVTTPNFALITLEDAANNIEVVRVTHRTAGGDTMTIVRAQEGTTARNWAAGSIVEQRLTAAGLGPLSVMRQAATAAAVRAEIDAPSRTGADASGTWGISITGNADTATVLQTARTINGVSFNGSANITLPTVNTTDDQSVGGVKTFTSQIVASGGVQGNVTGNAATVTNGVYTTGDQTISGVKTFSSAPVVPDDSFTFAKLQNIPTATILGRSSAGTGDVEALTAIQVDTGGNVGVGLGAGPYASQFSVGNSSDAVQAFASGALSVLRFGGWTSGSGGAARITYNRADGSIVFSAGTRDTPAERLRIDNSGNFFTGGVLPAFFCRAWVNFNGGTLGIRNSANVSSITSLAAGHWRANFSAAMPHANYAAALQSSSNAHVSVGQWTLHTYTLNAATTSVEIMTGHHVPGQLVNPENRLIITLAIFC